MVSEASPCADGDPAAGPGPRGGSGRRTCKTDGSPCLVMTRSHNVLLVTRRSHLRTPLCDSTSYQEVWRGVTLWLCPDWERLTDKRVLPVAVL